MAISSKTRKFIFNGAEMYFDASAFKRCFYKVKQDKHLTGEQFMDYLADRVNVTKDAVKNWLYGYNGPADLETVYALTEALGYSDKTILLSAAKGDKNMNGLTDLQLQSLKRIYDAVLDYLVDFRNTGGFTTDLWVQYADEGVSDIENEIYNYAETSISKVHTTIMKEYFYLHDLPVYKELEAYAYNDLYDIYDGKLGYAYRFETPGSADEDFEKAMKRLGEIVQSAI